MKILNCRAVTVEKTLAKVLAKTRKPINKMGRNCSTSSAKNELGLHKKRKMRLYMPRIGLKIVVRATNKIAAIYILASILNFS